MFDFTVKYFGFLKHVPMLPQVFDSVMKIRNLFSNRELLDFIDEIENEVLNWEKTSVRLHKFGGVQFDVSGKEIGHIHSNGLLDILFSKEIKNQLVKEGRVIEHHIFKNSGWISFYIRNKDDKNFAVDLLKHSYLMKM